MADIAGFVNKYFEMDPKTDDLLRSGKELEEGMKVLLEVPDYRLDLDVSGGVIERRTDPGMVAQALKWNRWVTVSNLGWGGMDTCSFIGVYEDGTKKLVEVPDNFAWYVKKNSIPEPFDVDAEKADLQERGRPVDGPGSKIWPTGGYPGVTRFDQLEA